MTAKDECAEVIVPVVVPAPMDRHSPSPATARDESHLDFTTLVHRAL